MSTEKVLLIINPVSGRQRANRMLYKIINFLCQSGCIPTVFITTKKGDALNIIKENAKEYSRIICFGGDGTLSEVFNGVSDIDVQIPIGYIPTGTINDLAYSLGLSKKWNEGINIAINGQSQRIDVGSFGGAQRFSYVASFGAFTQVSHETPQWLKNLMGRMAYMIYGVLSLTGIKSHIVSITADGKEIFDDFVFGSVSNSKILGSLIRLDKSEVAFSDGKFEVLLVKTPKNLSGLINTLLSILTQNYNNNFVYLFKASKVSFSFENNTDWIVDGEYADTLKTVCIENIQRKICIFVPNKVE